MGRRNIPWRMKVVADRPMRTVAIVVAVAIGFGVAGYWLGREHNPSLGSTADDNASATERVVELERRLADIKLGQVVDGDANASLRQTIKSLRDELSAAQDEVLFYRQLMAPSEAQRGLRIEKLELSAGTNAGEVKYRLLLTQVTDRADWVSGTVNVDVVGTSGGEQVVLPLTEMSQVESYPLSFKLRYFQDFSGTLVVPDGMKPEQVVVTAATSGKDGKRVQRTFSWTLEEE